uniref:adrenodoxin-like n=1 Tax=Myxine glutinosa TaxID=7769 RepID=UPI00358E3301
MAALRITFALHSVRVFCRLTRFSSRVPWRSAQLSTGACESARVNFVFVNRDGESLPVQGIVGETLLELVVRTGLDIDGFGACEGTLACSTCHVILPPPPPKPLPCIPLPLPSEEELDMLDMAYGLTDTSRLGCQVRILPEMEGCTIQVPLGFFDMREDD